MLGQGSTRIRLLMLRVELAHDLGGCFCFSRGRYGFRDLAADLDSQGIRDVQFRIVTTCVEGGENRKQGFITIERDLGRRFRRAHSRDQPEQGYKQRTSKPT